MSINLSDQQSIAVQQFADWVKPLINSQVPYWVTLPGKSGDAEESRHYSNREEFSPVYIQQGFAGTGKSTILPFMIEAAGLKPEEVCFIAPTGKAAKVMSGKLKDQGVSRIATTIHKAIYLPKMMRADVLESELEVLAQIATSAPADQRAGIQRKMKQLQKDLDRAYQQAMPSFRLNIDSNVIKSSRLVVIDEASMVGEEIAEDIRSFGTPILAIGDPGQLQPVNDRPGFFWRKPDHILTEIHRQALDNPIIWFSKMIREGSRITYGSHGGGALRIVEPKDDDATYDMERDAQIICGTNNKRWRMTREIRKRAGLHAQGPVKGELMICVKNSRQFPEIVNGTMLMVAQDTGELKQGDVTCPIYCVDENGRRYTMEGLQKVLEENYLGKGGATALEKEIFHAQKDDKVHQIDWGYVITAHKSQGSQWKEVVAHDESQSFRDQSRQWAYTCATRAEEKLTWVM